MSENMRKITLSAAGKAVVLEVTPSKITVEEPQISKSRDLLSGGYITMGKRGLWKTTLTTFIPAYGSSFHDPLVLGQIETFIRLRGWKESGTAVFMASSSSALPKGKKWYITSLKRTVSEDDYDIGIEIALTEARSLTKKAAVNSDAAQAAKDYKKMLKANHLKEHTTKKGDTLRKIAKKYYGDAGLWKIIYDANKKSVGCDPQKLKSGVKLIIPQKPSGGASMIFGGFA